MAYFMGFCIFALLIYVLTLSQKIWSLEKQHAKTVSDLKRMEKLNAGMLATYWKHDDQLSMRDYEIGQLKCELKAEKSKNNDALHGGFAHVGFSRQVKTRAHDSGTTGAPVTTSNDGLVFVGGLVLLDQCSSDGGYDCDSTPICTSQCGGDIAES